MKKRFIEFFVYHFSYKPKVLKEADKITWPALAETYKRWLHKELDNIFKEKGLVGCDEAIISRMDKYSEMLEYIHSKKETILT